MTTVLLVRHGRTTANADGVLAGRTPGVGLDEVGVAQAAALAGRLGPVPLDAVVTSPLERCTQTVGLALGGREHAVDVHPDDRVLECSYGDWTGRPLEELADDPLWRAVQRHPSSVRFPGEDGESLADVSARAVAAVRDWNARLGADAVYAVCSHGDVIKAVLADALGLHLDGFQRLVVEPCSVSVVRYTPLRPFVERMNDTGGSLAALVRATEPDPAAGTTDGGDERASDAVVGGATGRPD